MKKLLTLLIIHKNDQVLLGMKKRGFGVGLWNGFGGKVDPGETIEDAARRELFEEAGISAGPIEKMGMLDFSWQHKPSEILEVHIFKAGDFFGQPQETEEMKPQWFDAAQIPFEKMWADDKHWFRLFLQGKKFHGDFFFDQNNVILSHKLYESDSH